MIAWPQFAVLLILGMSLGMHVAKDGQPRTDHYTAVGSAVEMLIWLVLLYYGGFFAPLGLR